MEDLKRLVSCFKDQILQATGKHFPQDPEEQLYGAVSAVLDSWNNSRAVSYRELNNYPHTWGTAVMFKRWYLEIEEMIRRQGWSLHVIPLLEKNV